MFTILLTFVGLIVFVVSLFKHGFKASFGRLMIFTVTGLILDVIMTCIALGALVILS